METSQPTVSRVRKQYFEEGLEAALNRRPPNRRVPPQARRQSRRRASSRWPAREPPEGQARWSLRLLADKLVELEIVEEDVSYQTVRRTLKKTPSSPT